ncbi:MAG: outer membrane protein assembly factor, partial [Gemmatimonadaceae bacterium]
VSSKCRPVRLWNGLSSASLRLKATTRCWKAYSLIAGAILLAPALLVSQQPVPATPAAPIKASAPPPPQMSDHPEVVNLTLKGVKAVKPADLLSSIYTTASFCNSFILKPFCLISKSHLWFTRKYLDHKELERDVLRARIFYWKRGYRDTEVDTAVVTRGRNQVGVTFFIKEGPPTLVSNVVVKQDGLALLSQKEIDSRLAIGKNGPLNLIRIDSSRVLLQNRLFDKGYADAEVDTTVFVDTATRTASVTFTLNPKYKTTVEDIVIAGNDDVKDRTIKKSLTFHIGDVFRRSEMLRSQRALYESNLFRRASIEPRPPIDIATPDSAKVVVVSVVEAPPREARMSAGFNTIDFFQLEGRFTHYNFLGAARNLQLHMVVGNLFAKSLNGKGIFQNVSNAPGSDMARYFTPTYNASIDLREPWFGSPHNELAAGLFTHRHSAPGIYIDRGYGTSLTFTREVTERAPASLNYRFEVSKVDAGDVYFCVNYGVCDQPTLEALRGNQKLSPLTLTMAIDRTNDPFFPNKGYRANVGAEVANTFTLSDYRYNRLAGGGAAWYQVRKRGAVGARISAGWVRSLGSTFQAVGVSESLGGGVLHPRKRFYSGGANSVRGFGENQLGPRVLTVPIGVLQTHDSTNLACASGADVTTCDPNAPGMKDRDFEPRPLGGNFLLEGSVEARFPVWQALTGAAFVDAGTLTQHIDPTLPKKKTGITPGFGLRYASPVGPIRGDIALNPGATESLPVVTEKIVNGQRTLVTLTQRRTYNPTAGGFLNRLVVHLSIGEPF